MLYDITRQQMNCFGGESEEHWGDEIEADNITDAVDKLLNSEGFINNEYAVSSIDKDSDTAYFTITNRGRYKGDDFTIQPVSKTN